MIRFKICVRHVAKYVCVNVLSAKVGGYQLKDAINSL